VSVGAVLLARPNRGKALGAVPVDEPGDHRVAPERAS